MLDPRHTGPDPEETIRTIGLSLLAAAAVAAGIFFSRQARQQTPESQRVKTVPAGETRPSQIVLEELRKAGF